MVRIITRWRKGKFWFQYHGTAVGVFWFLARPGSSNLLTNWLNWFAPPAEAVFLLFPVVVFSLMLFSCSCFTLQSHGSPRGPPLLSLLLLSSFLVCSSDLNLSVKLLPVHVNDRRAVRLANRQLQLLKELRHRAVQTADIQTADYPCCLRSGKSTCSLWESLLLSWWLRVLLSLICKQKFQCAVEKVEHNNTEKTTKKTTGNERDVRCRQIFRNLHV